MSVDWNAFTLGRDWQGFASDTSFVGLIPTGISDDASLFKAVAKALRFPNYFGENWNALHDLLRDLSWIRQRDVILAHDEVPNIDSHSLGLYLEVLSESIRDWRDGEDHKLIVYFPGKSIRDLQVRVASTFGPVTTRN